mmetsp:Transcript_24939/g.41091  ORF Transcript_24939/g.41091 Transcript_24939/m.41091 type:complete len:256 (-) Transcript_24939:304-1071(-)
MEYRLSFSVSSMLFPHAARARKATVCSVWRCLHFSAQLSSSVRHTFEESGRKASSTFTEKGDPRTIIFVIGGPGSGKGTHSRTLAHDFAFTHLCPGELLRSLSQDGSEEGRAVNRLMKEGEIVPASITFELLKREMSASNSRHFLLDGFPRSLEQALGFESEVGECTGVLYFSCSTDVLERRLLNRGKKSGRVDDNPESIRKRLLTFRSATKQVIDHYSELGKLRTFDTDGDRNLVYSCLKEGFRDMIPNTSEVL